MTECLIAIGENQLCLRQTGYTIGPADGGKTRYYGSNLREALTRMGCQSAVEALDHACAEQFPQWLQEANPDRVMTRLCLDSRAGTHVSESLRKRMGVRTEIWTPSDSHLSKGDATKSLSFHANHAGAGRKMLEADIQARIFYEGSFGVEADLTAFIEAFSSRFREAIGSMELMGDAEPESDADESDDELDAAGDADEE